DAEMAMEQFEQRSLLDLVGQLLARYPEREQRIVALYFHEGHTLRQIAETLSLTEARISQILSKTLRSLREQLVLQREAA
ncbi:MAG TPA: sigma-70 family RNA polymerase sigma factor, partial [Rhodothermales bacterium]|nr:sigma-70 family RNA polymerase sigma factor [Rhodothermales bacterium]